MESQTERPLRILRNRKVGELTGDSQATRYRRIANGTFVPPISLGGPMVGWIETEIDAINAARIAGKSDEYLRSLVAYLIDQREGIAAAVLPPDELLNRTG